MTTEGSSDRFSLSAVGAAAVSFLPHSITGASGSNDKPAQDPVARNEMSGAGAAAAPSQEIVNEKIGHDDDANPAANNVNNDEINRESGASMEHEVPRSETGSTAGLTAGHGNVENEKAGASGAGAGAAAGAGAVAGAAAAAPLGKRQRLKNRVMQYMPSDETLYGPNPEGIPLNKKQKAKRHCGKWWWAHLIAWIIILAIALPLIFEVIIPAIVQDIVSSQSLPVINGTLRAISPGMIEISLNTTINTPIAARLGSFPLHLYVTNGTDQPFVNLTLPGQHIGHNTPVTVTNQSVPFTNETQGIWWLNQLYDEKEVELKVEGHPPIHLGALHYNPHLKKTLKFPGLNMLNGIGVEGLQIIYPALSNGYNINGTLNIPNAGVLGLGLGNISFNLMSGEVNLGLVHLYDVTLQPGNTSSFFEGELYFDRLLNNIGPILQSQANALGDGKIQLNATGNSTMINGQHIEYIERILNQKTLSLDISVITLLSDVISGYAGAGNASLINALTDVFNNKTLFQNINRNWEPPLYYANESRIATNARMRKRRSETRNAVMWNMLKLGMNMKRR